MKIIDLSTEYKAPTAIALGFFDCIHLGHRALIGSMTRWAANNGVNGAVLTYSNDLSAYFGGEKQIYNFEERAAVLADMCIDALIAPKFDEKIKRLSARDFLDMLTTKFNIKGVFVGEDHRFGKNAEGDVELLKSYCAQKGIYLRVQPFETIDGKKISTSDLKALVKCGDVEKLNRCLGAPYIMMGEVSHARHVGAKLGFPTANIPVSRDRLTLADGIYATTLTLDGKTYGAMTNIGAKPTFDDDEPSIETYIFDFDGDIYGKSVTLKAYRRTRDIKKFDSPCELIAQLKSDEENIRAILAKEGAI